MWRSRLVTVALCSGIIFSVNSQTIVSPYSSNGLGELVFSGMPNHIAMGEIGIGTPSFWQINSVNPATLVYNALTTFEVGFQADMRNFRGSNTNASDGTAGLRFLNISFPVRPLRWTTNVALLPYSTVNYNFFNTQQIANTDLIATSEFSGEGGLTRLDWAHGFRVAKRLSLGVKASYIFGSIRNFAETIVEDDETNFSIVYHDDVSHSDFSFQFGAHYNHNLTENKVLNFGLIYSPSSTLSGSRDEFFERRASVRPLQAQEIDFNQDADFELPQTIGFGVSYQEVNKLILGVDLEINNGGEFGSDARFFRRRIKLSAGGEITPDYNNVRSYWGRIKYRAGVKFEQVPYLIDTQEINDFSASLGTSLPIGVSTIDTAFRVGWRGDTANNLIRENYFQIVLGATINERWFIKRRYE